MKRILIAWLILSVLLFSVSVTLASQPPLPPSQSGAPTPPEGAEYVGTETCFQCHSEHYRDWSDTLHASMIQSTSVPGAVLADFSVGDEARTLEDGSTYTLEDVVYTMGSKYRQRYIAATEDGGFVVLPGQWLTESQQWVEYASADWLKDCVGCHVTGWDLATNEFSEVSIGCEACHGAGSVHVEAARALPEGVDTAGPEVQQVRQSIVSTVDAAVCGACHTRGTSPDGEHGYPVGYVVGGPLDETMFIPVTPVTTEEGEEESEEEVVDPYFWPDGTEKMHRQSYLAWLDSAHGNALSTIQDSDHGAEYCLRCHSTDYINQDNVFPEDTVTLENAQFSLTCVTCHDPHGASYPVDQLQRESYELCADCHQGTDDGGRPVMVGGEIHHAMREMFEGVSFLGIGPTPSRHFSNESYGPICASCHMVGTAQSANVGDIGTHTFNIILPTQNAEGQPDSCTGCHNLEHDDLAPEDLFFYVQITQEDTRERWQILTEDLAAINEAGDWDPEAEEKPNAQRLAERVHTLLSFIRSDGSWGVHNARYTDQILREAEDLVDELRDELELTGATETE